MKTIGMAAMMTMVVALSAQATPPMSETFEADLAAQQFILEAQPPAPNAVTVEDITYSGIGVQVFTAPQPLQMINPLAPEEYGQGEQNVERDPVTGQIVGLKFLAIAF